MLEVEHTQAEIERSMEVLCSLLELFGGQRSIFDGGACGAIGGKIAVEFDGMRIGAN